MERWIYRLGIIIIIKIMRKDKAHPIKDVGKRITIEPCKLPDLTQYFNSIEVDLKSDLSNWKAVKGELLKIH
ncbi:MAG: AbrB/MazE/SpoVT family DNA-binding domain-containing protein [archaeon YNP-WB-062]|nr:AbrB/MazE/SpoVT family DNA-binding domain-containing protein [Candidatus Culexarchaeum yellowstonense]